MAQTGSTVQNLIYGEISSTGSHPVNAAHIPIHFSPSLCIAAGALKQR